MAPDIRFSSLPDSALLRLRDFISLMPFSEVTLWRRVKTKQFPAPHRLPGRITCWRWGDVRRWLDTQATERSR
ncbi:AlpA family phage regulatory protein [Stenotrophomonas maltophilia]|uniref:helix-turn-helix transcriptional regulator n=1 Tax=Stenotrophomonas maltophilia group TaxID=995085 RepID=UPI001FA0B00C|nr:AlpA family phage regulatory protein [Stenotrophomonas maltophilia]MCF3517288.1 AlpA family phage regulatory protein [Stenotrophomonas maltophilia]